VATCTATPWRPVDRQLQALRGLRPDLLRRRGTNMYGFLRGPWSVTPPSA
jgi:hypothetical protein